MPVRIFLSHGRYADKAWWTDSDPSDPFDALNEWTQCGNEARKNIDRYIQSWKTEMDTLLVFGSLFSAIVTAFVIESYTWLQADSTDNTVLLLLQISAQLANQSQEMAQLPSYAPTASQVAINICWFASLILSLTAILLAIMIKQWLSEYSWPTGTISARQTMAMRQIRVDSLYDWHLSTIVDWLPLLMISSLFLFFGGVATLLFTMNIVVASVAAGFISLSLIIFLITSVLPTFAPECSYRSVQSFIFFLILSPIMDVFSKVPKAWEHVNSQTRVRMAQVEPRALIWILMNICPWKPSMYPQVSACARSLNRTIASRAICDLFRVSTLHEPVQFTKDQARRWQLRIGTDEFEQSCLLLADGAKTMPGGDWQTLDADDIVDYVKTLSVFFSLFSPDYLKKGRYSWEEYPSEVFRKGLEIMLDVVLGDRLPKHLPEIRQRELKTFVREQLYSMSNFEWPKRTEGQTVKDYVPELLSPVIKATIHSQTNKPSDPEEFIFLSTFALSLTRRMTREQTFEAQIHLVALVNSMTEFIAANTGGVSITLPRQAITYWMPMWFTPFSSKAESGQEGIAIGNWNTREPSVQDAMGYLLQSLSRAESLDADLWKGHEMYRDRLRMGFADAKVLSEVYISSAAYTSHTKDPWSKEHKNQWNTELTPVETNRLTQVLIKAFRKEHNSIYIRILCQVLPTLDFFSSASDEGAICLLDDFQSGKNINLVVPIAECLTEMIATQLSGYLYPPQALRFSMRLQKVLTVASNVTPGEVDMHRPLTILLGTVLESLSAIDRKDYPGISRLRTQTIHLLQQLQGLVLEWTQNKSNHDPSFYKPVVCSWIKSLERSVDKQSMIFFTQEPDCEAINHELRVFLELLEREGLVSELELDLESEVGTAFRKIREWSLVV